MDQIGNYLDSLITAGTLIKEANSIFLIYTPPDVITTSGQCANGDGYCGIHQPDVTASSYEFALMPDFSTCQNFDDGCGTGTFLANIQSTTTHEIVESITDPFSTTVYTGWADDQWGEIGDMCNQITDTLAGGTIQRWYSQLDGACISYRNVTLTGSSKINDQCNDSLPVNCFNGVCCPKNFVCGNAGTCSPPSNCPPSFPIACSSFCCSSGQVCHNSHCVSPVDLYGCPNGYDLNCGNGFCCELNQTCGSDGYCNNIVGNDTSCPDDYSVDCGNGYCCPDGSMCNETGSQTFCMVPLTFGCTDPGYPVNCGNGFCCLTNTICTTIDSVTYCDSPNPNPSPSPSPSPGDNKSTGAVLCINYLVATLLSVSLLLF